MHPSILTYKLIIGTYKNSAENIVPGGHGEVGAAVEDRAPAVTTPATVVASTLTELGEETGTELTEIVAWLTV